MTDQVVLHGMVLSAAAAGEYDKRLVILTKERGKIVAFAKGARRPKSMLMGGSRPFVYGEFTLYEGREAYNLIRTDIDNYFSEISEDIEATCYGCYFLELADYYTRENIESSETIKLLYMTLRALMNQKISNRLIKCIFELKLLTINGEYPQMFECVSCGAELPVYFSAVKGGLLCEKCAGKAGDAAMMDTSTIYAMQYTITAGMEKLYTFIVKDKVLEEMEFIMKRYFNLYIDKEFKSLEILTSILK